MKRILLACCLLAASSTFSYAQSKATPSQSPQAAQSHAAPQPPVVSKTDYTAQVGQMNTLMTSNKMDDAQRKWDDVHKMMMNTLAATKYKMRDAHEANNQEEMKKLGDVMVKQRNLYSEILQLVRTDMSANKTQINTKLTEFGSTIN